MSKLTFVFICRQPRPVKMSSKFLTFAKGEVDNIFIVVYYSMRLKGLIRDPCLMLNEWRISGESVADPDLELRGRGGGGREGGGQS